MQQGKIYDLNTLPSFLTCNTNSPKSFCKGKNTTLDGAFDLQVQGMQRLKMIALQWFPHEWFPLQHIYSPCRVPTSYNQMTNLLASSSSQSWKFCSAWWMPYHSAILLDISYCDSILVNRNQRSNKLKMQLFQHLLSTSLHELMVIEWSLWSTFGNPV